MNSRVILVAESGSDVSAEMAESYGIYVVPMHVAFGEDDRKDGAFPTSDIIDYYQHTGKIPKTSGCSQQDFDEVFDRIRNEHPESDILYLAYSAQTTCSYDCAALAAKNRPYVRLIDTKLVSAGQCAVVMHMAEALREHPEWNIDQAVSEAERIIRRTKFQFYPTNLRFLQAGGRLSNAAAVFGMTLKIVPQVELIDGLLIAKKKLRGKLEKLLPKVIHDFAEKNHLDRRNLFFVVTPGITQLVRKIGAQAAAAEGFLKCTWLESGGVITTHGGPSAIGIAGYMTES